MPSTATPDFVVMIAFRVTCTFYQSMTWMCDQNIATLPEPSGSFKNVFYKFGPSMEIIHFDSSFLVASKIPPKNPFWKRIVGLFPSFRDTTGPQDGTLVSRRCVRRSSDRYRSHCQRWRAFCLGLWPGTRWPPQLYGMMEFVKKKSLSCFQFSKEVERENGCFLAFLDSRDSKSQNGFIVNWRTILPNGKVSCLLILGLLLKLWGTTYLVP